MLKWADATRNLSTTSTLPALERRVDRAEPRAETPPPLRASDTFPTTKHVSLCNAVSALNADLFKDLVRLCDVCWPIDAHPIAGETNIRFSLFGRWGWLHIYLFCWSFGAIFILGLFKYPGTLTRWWWWWWGGSSTLIWIILACINLTIFFKTVFYNYPVSGHKTPT